MVWLGACSKGLLPLVNFENETVDRKCYINEVPPVVLKYGNRILGNDWIFQQDGAKAHFHEKAQEYDAPTIFLRSFRGIIGFQIVLI